MKKKYCEVYTHADMQLQMEIKTLIVGAFEAGVGVKLVVEKSGSQDVYIANITKVIGSNEHEHDFKFTGKIITTNPPQYGYECDCGESRLVTNEDDFKTMDARKKPCEHKYFVEVGVDGDKTCYECGEDLSVKKEEKLTPDLLNGWWKHKEEVDDPSKIDCIGLGDNAGQVFIFDKWLSINSLFEHWEPITDQEACDILHGEDS